MARIEIDGVILVCVFPLVLTIFFSSALAVPTEKAYDASSEKVRDLCNNTGYYGVCIEAIDADDRSNLKSNPRGILRILMDKTLSNITAMNNHISYLLTNPKLDGDARDSLEGCGLAYGKAIYDLKGAFRLINFRNSTDYDLLKDEIGFTEVSPFDCEQNFIQRNRPVRSPLTALNNYIQDLANVVLATVDYIYHSRPKYSIQS